LHPTLGEKVGLRMGNGVIKGKPETPICYATCGYMKSLMAHNPSFFEHHTHIIIDEVHERSIESDLLCLIVRRLMFTYQDIKLILMSATMNPDLFKTYFSSIQLHEVQSINVGVSPYKVKEKYLKDLLEFELSTKAQNEISDLINIISNCSGKEEVRINTMTVIIVINCPATIVSSHFLPCHCCDYHGCSFLTFFHHHSYMLYVTIIITIDIITMNNMIIIL
jgi:hypothetical protein